MSEILSENTGQPEPVSPHVVNLPLRRNSWPEWKTDQLRSLWKDGVAIRIMAAKLGCTRNAVIGKAHRLNLPKRRLENSDPRPRFTRPSRAKAKAPSAALTTPSAIRVAAPPPQPIEVQPPVNGGVSLFDLGSDQCRYIVGQTGGIAMFCGHPVDLAIKINKRVQAAVYCRGHAVVCYSSYEPNKPLSD